MACKQWPTQNDALYSFGRHKNHSNRKATGTAKGSPPSPLNLCSVLNPSAYARAFRMLHVFASAFVPSSRQHLCLRTATRCITCLHIVYN
eukprot:10153221-Alexandrium_andersonii.AAC.1